jgi:hypothetical protein
MRYLCEKTATYNNTKILCGNAKLILYFSKIPRVKKYFTRIRLITAHVTLTHAILSNEETVRLKKKRASYGDRLASSLESHNVEKNIKSRIFASEINKEN